MRFTLKSSLTYVFAVATILASLAFEYVGGMAIRAGTLVGGATLMFVGLLFAFAGVLALPPSRRWLRSRFEIGLSTRMTVLLSGSAVTLGLLLLFAAFIELLVSG